jgi:hypothetical protein
VEVEPLDAVKIKKGEHGAQGGQQHTVLYLEVLDGLTKNGDRSLGEK